MDVTNDGKPADHVIDKATASDAKAVSSILGSAFSHDPVFNWFCEAGGDFYARLFHSELQLLYNKHQHVFVNESRTGAAMWLPPGVSAEVPNDFSQLGLLFGMLLHGGFASLQRGGLLTDLMSKHHMKEPHYYLHAIGAHLDCQGRGIGSALLKHGVSLCDEAGFPAYLESSNIRNNPLYERFGFEVTEELTLPDGGPSMWLMVRPAP